MVMCFMLGNVGKMPVKREKRQDYAKTDVVKCPYNAF